MTDGQFDVTGELNFSDTEVNRSDAGANRNVGDWKTAVSEAVKRVPGTAVSNLGTDDVAIVVQDGNTFAAMPVDPRKIQVSDNSVKGVISCHKRGTTEALNPLQVAAMSAALTATHTTTRAANKEVDMAVISSHQGEAEVVPLTPMSANPVDVKSFCR